jgi:hypothetical protein
VNRFIPFFLLLFCICLLPVSQVFSQPNFQRIAIVVGNGEYKQQPLKNPINDAKAVSLTLRSYGFDVTEFLDVKGQEAARISQIIKTKVSTNTTFIFYYAGHGVQVDGANYFPNVDLNFKDLQTLQQGSIKLNEILKEISTIKPKAAVVILDACRDNPFDPLSVSKESYKGLARAISPPGSVIFYATRPGSTASDGRGENGLFTEVLLKEISNPQLPLELLFRRVSSGVFKSSKGEQEPWVEGVIREEIIIAAREENVQMASISNAISISNPVTIEPAIGSQPNKEILLSALKPITEANSAENKPSISELNQTAPQIAVANLNSNFTNQAEAIRSLKNIDLEKESLNTYFYCEDNKCRDYLSVFKEMRNKRQFPKLIESANNITLCQYDLENEKCTSEYLSFGTGVNPLMIFQALFGSDVIAKSIKIKSLDQSNSGGISFSSEPNISIIRSRLNISNNVKCNESAGRVELMSDRLEFEIAANTCIQATPPIPSGFKLTFDVLAYDQSNKDFYVRWKGTGYSFMYYSSKEGVARVSFR